MKIDVGDPSGRTIGVDNLTYQTSIFDTSFNTGIWKLQRYWISWRKVSCCLSNDSNIASNK